MLPAHLYLLPGTEVWILLALFYCDQTGLCTSLSSISRVSHKSVPTVVRGLKKLAERGFITKQLNKGGDNGDIASTYVINTDAVLEATGDVHGSE
jgi:CTP-dependent riboflavin kinase